jgi:hypothetical protein
MTVTGPSPPGYGRAERPVAVVTGANRGIGRDVARQLAGHGFVVIAGTRDPGQGERAARQLDPAGGTVIALRLDVTDPATVEAAASWTVENLGRADVLVNNAAIAYDTWQQAQNADLGVVREALDTNLLGAWRTTQAFLPLLRRSAHARIVNVSSEGGSISEMTGGTPAYSVSKAGLNGLPGLDRHGHGPGRPAGGRRRGQRDVGRPASRRRAHRRFLPGRPGPALVTHPPRGSREPSALTGAGRPGKFC